jgi:hypothetical protein
MSENKLVGSLVLRTIDIDPARVAPCAAIGTPLDNDYGLCTANGAVVTWKNVNIRTCLGELYQKHKRFNLKVTGAQIKQNTAATVEVQFMIYMSGLPFSPGSTYSTRLGPTNQACVGAVSFVTSGTVGTTTSLLSGLVSFDKPLQDVINITVELKNSVPSGTTVNGFTEKPPNILSHWSLMCDIYGIE